MDKCLYCYGELTTGQPDFHCECSKKMFGTVEPPVLGYARDAIADLAKYVVRMRTSVVGDHPKLPLHLDLKGKELPKWFSVAEPSDDYVLKFQSERYRKLPELEDLTMHLAEIAKIKTVPHSLIRLADGELCCITKRIDRDKKKNLLPMEDMCQLSERTAKNRYKGSYEQVAKIILKYSAAPKLDLANFWERVLFCWLIGNADMHLKNISLYSGSDGLYTLAPACDMHSTALVMPDDKDELALTLNRKKSNLRRFDFEIAFSQSGLNKKVIHNIFTKFGKALPEWIRAIDGSFLDNEMKGWYKTLINNMMATLFTND